MKSQQSIQLLLNILQKADMESVGGEDANNGRASDLQGFEIAGTDTNKGQIQLYWKRHNPQIKF